MRLYADYTPLPPQRREVARLCCKCEEETLDGGYEIGGDFYCSSCFENLSPLDICTEYVEDFEIIGAM